MEKKDKIQIPKPFSDSVGGYDGRLRHRSKLRISLHKTTVEIVVMGVLA